ncbi:amidohydrolase family protein [Halobellus sp. GM3]|uniref:amidohydrolase family protein n=1 Tax=Halobellus sp. GM3 TaxID=3458410 RepID=UPI00403D7577
MSEKSGLEQADIARPLREIDPSVEDYTIVDTDVHSYIEIEEFAEYMDEDNPWRRRFGMAEEERNAITQFWPGSVGSRARYGRIKRSHQYTEKWDKDLVLDVMDYLSTDHSLLLGMAMLMYGEIAKNFEDRRMIEHAEAYTELMLDHLVDPGENIYTLLPAPYTQPHKAAEMIDDYESEEGIVGVCLITPGATPPLGNRKYNPIYEAAEDAGLPIVFHSGGAGLDEYETKGFESFIETHTLGFMNANLSQLTSVVMSGVPERYPDLDFALVESGIGYVAALMYRLDSEYLSRQSEAPYLEKLPSDYLKNDFYYGTQPLEQTPNPEDLEKLMRLMGGPDNLMYASDYPHWDYDPANTITQLPFLSEDEKRKVLSENAMEVFDL